MMTQKSYTPVLYWPPLSRVPFDRFYHPNEIGQGVSPKERGVANRWSMMLSRTSPRVAFSFFARAVSSGLRTSQSDLLITAIAFQDNSPRV
jgi:hypothetical protein